MYNNVYFNNLIFQVYTQSYNQPQPPQQPSISLECGVQDKDELPDFHAAAPWGTVRLAKSLLICYKQRLLLSFSFNFFYLSEIPF